MNEPMELSDGLRMPRIGFGTWRLTDESAPAAVAAALEDGYRLIDTAELYKNEKGVGEGVRASGLREEVVVQSKVWNDHHGTEEPRRALERSLELLGLDRIDVYLVHWPAPAQDLYVDTWRALAEAREEGLVASIGVSNFLPAHIERLIAETGVAPALNQIELHPYFNQAALRDWHAEKGIAVQAWGPLGQRSGSLMDEPVLREVSEAHGKDAGQVILRWHLQHGTVPVPKSSNPERIRSNLEVFDFELSDAEMEAIDGLDTGVRQGMDPETVN